MIHGPKSTFFFIFQTIFIFLYLFCIYLLLVRGNLWSSQYATVSARIETHLLWGCLSGWLSTTSILLLSLLTSSFSWYNKSKNVRTCTQWNADKVTATWRMLFLFPFSSSKYLVLFLMRALGISSQHESTPNPPPSYPNPLFLSHTPFSNPPTYTSFPPTFCSTSP